MNDIQNVLNIGNRASLTQRTDGQPVTAVTVAVAEVNVSCRAANRQAVVSIKDGVMLE